MIKKKWIAAIAATALIFAGKVNAQMQHSESDMYLFALDTLKLEDVVVSSLKVDKKLAETPANLSIINSLDFKFYALSLVERFESLFYNS